MVLLDAWVNQDDTKVITFFLLILAPIIAIFYVMYLMLKAAVVLFIAFINWLIGLV